MKFGTLSQKHPEYNRGLWDLMDALYEGGESITPEIRHRLLPRGVNENPLLHDVRCDSAAYINYMGEIVDFFAAAVFRKTLSVHTGDDKKKVEPEAVYQDFFEDADGRGGRLEDVLKSALTQALVTKRAYIGIDLPRPSAGAEVNSLADEERLGLDEPNAFEIKPAELIDWREGDDGFFEWAILHRQIRERKTPEDSIDRVTFQWKIWRMVDMLEDESGDFDILDEPVAGFQVFERVVELDSRGRPREKLSDHEEIPMVDAGITSFKQVPIVKVELSAGLWAGNKLYQMAKEHFSRRTKLVFNQGRSISAIPWVKLGPEIAAPRGMVPSEAQSNPNRGVDPKSQYEAKGYLLLGADDDVGYVEPEGGAFEIENKQVRELVDEMFRVVHLMAHSVSSTSNSVGRSGISKMEDRSATEIVLEAFGDTVSKSAVRVYDVISAARDEDLFWSADGMTDYKTTDRKLLLEEATSVASVGIKSVTFDAMYQHKLALAMLDNLSPEVEAKIRAELESSAKDAEDKAKKLADSPPPVPGMPAQAPTGEQSPIPAQLPPKAN